MYGSDYGYAGTRIQNTIVRLKKDGSPVYVLSVGPTGVCLVCHIEVQDWTQENAISVHLDELNMSPVRMGYINTAGEATYAMRIPMRRDWKQGLRQENCLTSARRLFAIPMKDLKNCIMNVYPSWPTVVTDVQKGVTRGRVKIIAWHRHWALDTKGTIYYKDMEPVGKLKTEGDLSWPELDEKHQYLKEALLETLP